jgi:cytochrome c553
MIGRAAALAACCLAAAARADTIDDKAFPVEEKCAYCHGYDGNSRMARFPRLGGQDYTYVVKQLVDFRAGRRTNDDGVMATNVEQLSDEEIRQAARHFSRQPPARSAEPAAASPAGEALFRRGKPEAGVPPCAHCHAGPHPAAGPRLFGQHAAYLEKQLGDFRAGRRGNDGGATMRGIAAKLSAAEIEAVARYLEARGAAD